MAQIPMISKNEVLKRTGISYGQFYRWKRKGLIPEAWFNRRSTFTGQETFLPQEKILERIRRINELKDDHSLDATDVTVLCYSPFMAQIASFTAGNVKV